MTLLHSYLQDAQASSAKATPVLSLQLSGVEVADVFRYAVLHAQGGYYADGDVMCMSPIRCVTLHCVCYYRRSIIGVRVRSNH